MAGSKTKKKIWRCASKTKKLMRRFLTHALVRDVLGFLLMLGIFYFTLAGVLTLALRTDSFWMAVISPSMTHDGEEWRDYFENEETRQQLFLQAGLTDLAKSVGAENTSTFPLQGGFERGDLLFIQGVTSVSEIAVGDVLIMDQGPGVIPLVHRVIAIWGSDGEACITTKGDANNSILQIEKSIKPEQIIGKVVLVIPKIGHISLWFQGQ